MADLIDVAEARRRVLDAARPLGVEAVPVPAARGRVLREDVAAELELPPFDSSAMDGYAVIAGPGDELPVVAESRAGHPSTAPLRPGEAIAISTGARVPAAPGAAVVPIEQAEPAGDGRVRVYASEPGAHVRRAGEDVRAGDTVLSAGTGLGPAELAIATSLGRTELLCGARPRVAVLVTGDELVPPGRPLGPGQIRDSNMVALAAQVAAAGGGAALLEAVGDDAEATVAALERALEGADVVCVSGGVSAGEHDHVRPALTRLGIEERFFGVRLKPGKPTWFGTGDGRMVFGLPGNPVSAMVTFQLFARPALRRLQGAAPDDARSSARLDAPVKRDPQREQALRCRLRSVGGGFRVEPRERQGSHVLSSMVGAGALAMVPAGEGTIGAGEAVEVELLTAC